MYNEFKRRNYSVEVRENFQKPKLEWIDLVSDEMPILRENWVQLQSEYHVYLTECEIQRRQERMNHFWNFKKLIGIER